MTESDDNKKRKNILNDWTNNPFERVNHSTNFEDYAISSSDESEFHYEKPNHSEDNTTNSFLPKVTQNANKDSLQNAFKISLKSHKFEASQSHSRVTPIISTHLSADQRDHSFVDSCLSAGNSSADVTPSGTPQSSPYTMRKVMADSKMVNKDKNTLSANPKRWFYTGFFNPENKPTVDDKPLSSLPSIPSIPSLTSLSSQIPRNPSFKNLCVSNFDINAVGPTSW